MWNSLLRNLAVAVAVGTLAVMQQADTDFWNLVPETKTFTVDYLAGEETYTLAFDNTLEKYYGDDYPAFVFELSLQKENEVLQQFTFDAEYDFKYQFDDLNFDGYQDLVVNYFDWGQSHINYYYVWTWNPEEGKFHEERIELDNNYEIIEGGEVFITLYGDLLGQDYNACRIEDGEIIRLRRFYLDRYDGTLFIEDCVNDEILYEGPLEEDEEGNLLNVEFYEEIFWEGIEPIGKISLSDVDPIDECYFEKDDTRADRYPETLLNELAVALQNDSMTEFLDIYEAECQVLSEEEIAVCAKKYVVLRAFENQAEGTYKWVKAELLSENDIVVCDGLQGANYYFEKGCFAGIPIYGKEVFFIDWEGKHFVVTTYDVPKIAVYYFDGATVGNVAVLEKKEIGQIEERFYGYVYDMGTPWSEGAGAWPE